MLWRKHLKHLWLHSHLKLNQKLAMIDLRFINSPNDSNFNIVSMLLLWWNVFLSQADDDELLVRAGNKACLNFYKHRSRARTNVMAKSFQSAKKCGKNKQIGVMMINW